MPLSKSSSAVAVGLYMGWCVAGCSSLATTEPTPTLAKNRAVSATLPRSTTATKGLPLALAELKSARFADAEISLRRLIAEEPTVRARAEVALAELLLSTGKRETALLLALTHCQPKDEVERDGCFIAAEALARTGALERAIELLRPFSERADARKNRLLLADLLAEQGLTSEARLTYKRLIRDYNENRFDKTDTEQLALTGRAAHRMGFFHDANEWFNQAELGGVSNVETLIFRGELYLDAHDPKHARAVADEALRFAPDHPGALLLFAKVRLNEARDSEAAERHAQRVLELDPTNADAYFILAGLSLRDLDFENTHRLIDAGLTQEPRHLELLSLRAAAYFLADETEPWKRTVAEVLKNNPDYSKLFRLVAEYAEAEHRYAETIPLLRRAAALDPNDAQVHAQLGIQLVRSGEEAEGRRELLRAFAQDPFDLRVRNTLVLFERELDHAYTSYSHPPFEIRVPRAYQLPLEQFVSPFLTRAYKDLSGRYGKLEHPNIRIELYAEQESFGVRTSGVPSSFLQGVCFGNTVVARLPLDEPVNVGMTLWHELSHVFHLQLSNHRVPRWFTEGLAEFETKRHRSEWSREQEIDVYEALNAGKVPNILEMNQAFSHASSLTELTIAYVSSTYLVEYLVERFGFRAMPKLLHAWSRGLSTPQVLTTVLAVSLEDLNGGFHESVKRRLSHFDGQYLPPSKRRPSDTGKTDVDSVPYDPKRTAMVAQAELLGGQLERCRTLLEKVEPKDAHHADILWVRSLLAIAEADPGSALKSLDELLNTKHDGYFVRLQRALAYRLKNETTAEETELHAAHRFYPTAAEPLYRLMNLAQASADRSKELKYVADLCNLEESDVRLHQRHVELRLALKQTDLAWKATEALLFVDPLNAESQYLAAKAARDRHDRAAARKAYDLALLLARSPADRERLEGLKWKP